MFGITKSIIFGLLAATVASAGPPLDFNSSKWIWTNEVSGPVNAPVGSRAFLKYFSTNASKIPTSIEAIVSCDNDFVLFVNGVAVGSGDNYQISSYFCFGLNPLNNVVIAVTATNVAGSISNPAGILATFRVNYATGDSDVFVTDGSWSFSPTLDVPSGYQAVGYYASNWTPATVEGPFGIQPWGAVPPPSSQVC